MVYLLDTMTFVFAFAAPNELPKRVLKIFDNPQEELLLSTVSLSEIAIKTAIGKLHLPFDRARAALANLRVTLQEYRESHVEALFALPLFSDHRDPFDRMLIATALAQDLPIVTGDKHFKRYRMLKVIWN
ncbi:MAG TPA: type II toxin-antitoxin system VapC family toxin [Bryobacteraceae bacterium]